MKKSTKVVLGVSVGGILLLILGALAFVGLSTFLGGGMQANNQPQQQQVSQKDPLYEEKQVALDNMLKNAKREIVRNEYGSAEVYYLVTNDSEYELEYLEVVVKGMDANGTTIDTGSGNEINILPGETARIEVLFTDTSKIHELGKPQFNANFTPGQPQ